MDKRDDTGRFQPGTTPGPGRPRGQTLAAELRRQGSNEAVAAELLRIVHDKATSTRDRLAAIQMFADRTEGRAIARSISATAKVSADDLAGLTPDQLIERSIAQAALPEPEDAELVEVDS